MGTGKKGIIFAGNVIVDQLKVVESWPRQMGLTCITSQSRALGGLAGNCSLDMAKLAPEVPIRVVAVIGEDALGDFIIDELSKFPSIDAGMVMRSGETSYTDVITTPGGERTFFYFPGAGATLGPEHFDFTKLDADIMHIGYILLLAKLDAKDPDYPTGMCRVLDMAGKAGIMTSVDLVSETGDRYKDVAVPAFAYADIVTINDIEAEGVTGISLRDKDGKLLYDAIEPCARAIASFGVRKWVCVHMPEIAVGIDIKSGEYFEANTFSLPEGFISSTVGAGDAFATGLLYAAYRGRGLNEALYEANTIAAYSLSGSSASGAIKPLAEILKEMEQYR